MMYQNKLVACIKVNGRILRETGNCVTLPFGCEYSILLKNLNSVRVQAKVSIDGQSMTDGTWLVISPNSTLELERSIKNGNFNSGNRFKFIQRTGEIEAHRGIGVDDGLVRVEYQTERVDRTEHVNIQHHHHYDPPYDPWYPWDRPWPWRPRRRWSDMTGTSNSARPTRSLGGSNSTFGTPTYGSVGEPIGAMNSSVQSSLQNTSQAMNANLQKCADAGATLDFADAGITVPGSQSFQQFQSVSGFRVLDHTDVIVLHLRGEIAGRVVTTPVTVDVKPKCGTCGKTNNGGSQYCSACGTALVDYATR